MGKELNCETQCEGIGEQMSQNYHNLPSNVRITYNTCSMTSQKGLNSILNSIKTPTLKQKSCDPLQSAYFPAFTAMIGSSLWCFLQWYNQLRSSILPQSLHSFSMCLLYLRFALETRQLLENKFYRYLLLLLGITLSPFCTPLLFLVHPYFCQAFPRSLIIK